MLKSIFTLCLIALFASFAFRSHYASMLMYWWFGTFKPHNWMWWDISSLRLPLMSALLLGAHSFFAKLPPRVDNTLAKLMVALLCLATIAQLLASCGGYKIITLSYIAILITMVLLSERLLTSLAAICGLLVLVGGSLGFYSAKAGLNAARTGRSLYGLPTEGGSFADSNGMALATAMMLFFLFFIVQVLVNARGEMARPRFFRPLLVRIFLTVIVSATIGGSVYFVMATQSRGSALSMLLGMALWLWLHRRRFRMLTYAMIACSVLLAAAPLSESYRERLASAFADEEDLDASAASRPHFWSVAVIMATRHPFGVGIGCYPTYYNRYDTSGGFYGTSRSVHSSHYSILAELGFPGLVVWSFLFIVTYLRLWRVRAAARSLVDKSGEAWCFFYLSNTLIVSQTVFVVGGSFYEMGFNDFTWLIFGMTIAVSRLYESSSFYRPAAGAPKPLGASATPPAPGARAEQGEAGSTTRGLSR